MVGRQTDRQTDRGRAGGRLGALLASSPLWTPLFPGHAAQPPQEVEARGASARHPAWDRRRRRRRGESAVIFSFSSLQGLS